MFREFLDKGLEKGRPESLCKEQSQITLFKSPLIRSRNRPSVGQDCESEDAGVSRLLVLWDALGASSPSKGVRETYFSHAEQKKNRLSTLAFAGEMGSFIGVHV